MRDTINLGRFRTVFFILAFSTFYSNQVFSQTKPSEKNQEPPTFSKLLSEMDADKDGKLSKKEVKGRLKNDFSKVDLDNDGFITEDEFDKAPKPKGGKKPEKRS